MAMLVVQGRSAVVRSRTSVHHSASCLRRLTLSSHLQQAPFKVLFLGRDAFSSVVLNELLDAPDVYESVAVATQPEERVGRRGAAVAIPPLAVLAGERGLTMHAIPAERAAFRSWELPSPFGSADVPDPTHLLVTASFGRILTRRHLAAFAHGRALNVHPSLLPALRGPAPIQRTLLAGLPRTGVCVAGTKPFTKAAGVDVGGVWGRWETDVAAMAEDGKEVDFARARDFLGREGGRLLVRVLREMRADTAKEMPQEVYAEGQPPYSHAPVITGSEARVDWAAMSAADIARVHRAIGHQKPPTVALPDGTTPVALLAVSALSSAPAASAFPPYAAPGTALLHGPAGGPPVLHILCAGGTVLAAYELQQSAKRALDAKAFWNGLVSRPEWVARGEDGRKLVQLRDGPLVS